MTTLYEIGPFQLDLEAQVLTHAGTPLPLGPRAIAVLAALVERAEKYVPKHRILEIAWPGVLVEEANLAVQVSAIRRVLGRVPGGESWIETLARRGYRFVGPVTERRREFPSLRSVEATALNNLPQQLTSFIGREKEIAELKALLATTRLLTLTGSGGCGKTRLSLQLAADALEKSADGVWVVELAALVDPTGVPQAVASVLGLGSERGTSLTRTITDHLRSRQLLLVLDNCEHLIETCATLADALLRQCPQVVVLATSRQPLGIGGERTYRVPSLTMPNPKRDVTPESLSQFESARLYTERAQLQRQSFVVTEENAPALASICYRLDGIPLAIELAAARMRTMSVEQIERHLDQRFRLLVQGSRAARPRQQTLRAVLEWSYELLADAERIVFRRLGVFIGGFSLQVAQCVVQDDGLTDWGVVDALAGLVDKSMIAIDPSDPQHYRLLQTSRAYALERLEEAGETQALMRRHARAFVAVFESTWEERWQRTPAELFSRHRRDLENLRVAIDWTSRNDHEQEVALAGAAAWLWCDSGLNAEGVSVCENAALHVDAETPAKVEARVLSELVRLGQRILPIDAATRALDRARALYCGTSDQVGSYIALLQQAHFLAASGDECGAGDAIEEAEALEKPSWPPRLRLQRLSALGWALGFTGPVARLFAIHKDMHDLARLAGSKFDEVDTGVHLVRDHVIAGRLDDAIHDGSQLVQQCRSSRLTESLAGGLLPYVGLAFALRGDLDEASRVLREAVPLGRLGGSLWRVVDVFALVALGFGRTESAARLFGVGCTGYARRGHMRQIIMRTLHDDVLHRLTGEFAPEVLSRLIREGELMTDISAAALAIGEVGPCQRHMDRPSDGGGQQ